MRQLQFQIWYFVDWLWLVLIEDFNVRWLLLLLLVLNVFYYVWHQQQSLIELQGVEPVTQSHSYQKNISLLSELPDKAERKIVASAVAVDPTACMFFGSFDSLEEAEVLRQRLAGLDIGTGTQEVSAVSGVDYWVYLPPLASRSASLRQLKELQAMQIDSFIIAEGDLANGISLGIFPYYESAASVISRLSEMGYEPFLRELSRDERNFWVMVNPSAQRLVDDAILASLATDFGGLRHEMRPCEASDMKGSFE